MTVRAQPLSTDAPPSSTADQVLRARPPVTGPPRGAPDRAATVAVHLLLWGYAAAALAPLLLMAVNSVRAERDLRTDPLGVPASPVFDNYLRAWSEASFSRYFLNSVVVTVAAVALGTGVSVLAAYPLARHRFPGNTFLTAYFLSGLMLPIRLGIVPVFYLLNSLDLVDSRTGLILVYAASGVPFSVFVLSAFFRQLPGELEDAARIDGAGELRIFGQVMVPLVRPALATVALFQFIPLWNDFFFPLVLVDSDKYTLPVGLTRFFAEYELTQSLLYAGLVITTIPLVVLFLAATKQIVAGLTAGMSR